MEGNKLFSESIKVERSERANEQAQVVSNMITTLDIEQKQRDELVYQLSKLLLFTEMDCAVEGYIKGVEAVRTETTEQKKGKWLI